LFGVWLFQFFSAHHADAMTTATEMLARAERAPSAGACIAGNLCKGDSLLHVGAIADARRCYDEGIEVYRGVNDAEATRIAHEFGQELGAPTYAYAAWCFWFLGYPDRALQLGDEALAIIERVEHGFTRSRGQYWISAFHAYRREWSIVEERAAAAIASAQERGLAMVVAVGRIMRGAARAMVDPKEEFAAEIREGLAAYRATGARAQSTYHLVLLAQR
jgi:hypothetical protein